MGLLNARPAPSLLLGFRAMRGMMGRHGMMGGMGGGMMGGGMMGPMGGGMGGGMPDNDD